MPDQPTAVMFLAVAAHTTGLESSMKKLQGRRTLCSHAADIRFKGEGLGVAVEDIQRVPREPACFIRILFWLGKRTAIARLSKSKLSYLRFHDRRSTVPSDLKSPRPYAPLCGEALNEGRATAQHHPTCDGRAEGDLVECRGVSPRGHLDLMML